LGRTNEPQSGFWNRVQPTASSQFFVQSDTPFEPFPFFDNGSLQTIPNGLSSGGSIQDLDVVFTDNGDAPGLSARNDTFLMTFDENGHATINVNGTTMPLSGALMVDPAAPAGSPLALTYMLPETVITGDVSFTEPGGGSINDLLRFTDVGGFIDGRATGTGPRMIFYSDIEPSETGVLADTGAPANIFQGNFLECGINPFCAGETGPEAGPNGFDYRPGGVPAPQNNEYVGLSDPAPVPEPSTWLLFVSGLVGIGFVRKQWPH
jgi:hypothetical protein